MGLKIYSSILNISNGVAQPIAETLVDIPTANICGAVLCGTSQAHEYHQLLGEVKSAIHNSLGKKVPVTLIPQHLLPNDELAIMV